MKKKEAKSHHEREAEAGVAGAVAGAAIGAVAGPPGAIAGAVIGAAAGAISGAAIEKTEDERGAEERELDASVGVTSGEIGAPNLKHPPAKRGAYSVASSIGGGGEPEEETADGPIQPPVA